MSDSRVSQRSVRILGIAALALGGLAAFARTPDFGANARVDVQSLARSVEAEEDHVSAIELAEWIRSRREGLRIVDVRSATEFDSYHIPTAERIPLLDLVNTPFRSDETIVLYSDGGAHAAQGWVFLRALGYRKVYFLRGGLFDWLDQVLNPAIAKPASDTARATFEKAASLSRYFGGVPRAGSARPLDPAISIPTNSDSAHSSTSAVARIRGRGC